MSLSVLIGRVLIGLCVYAFTQPQIGQTPRTDQPESTIVANAPLFDAYTQPDDNKTVYVCMVSRRRLTSTNTKTNVSHF